MLIRKHVIHVINKNSEIILNDFEGKNNLNIEKFIEKQVKKIMKHDLLRKAKFLDYENNIIRNCADIIAEDKVFLSSSKEIASYYYELLTESGELESCDLLVASILIKDKSYVAILKLDYKKMHNHKIDLEDEKFNIQIIENEIAIQSTSVKQAAIVEINSLEIYDLFVLDIEGEKIDDDNSVFVKKFLNVEKIEDEAYKTKKFIRLSNIWINNAIPDSLEAEKIRETRNYMLKERSVMDLDEFSEKALDNEQDKLFKRFCENYELENFTIDKNVVENKLKKRKIGTFSGFEISGRLEDFSDRMKFKIERNTDGSCDLIIKNVDFYDK